MHKNLLQVWKNVSVTNTKSTVRYFVPYGANTLMLYSISHKVLEMGSKHFVLYELDVSSPYKYLRRPVRNLYSGIENDFRANIQQFKNLKIFLQLLHMLLPNFRIIFEIFLNEITHPLFFEFHKKWNLSLILIFGYVI